MRLESFRADNKGTFIHYLDSSSDSSLVPLLICPGLSETAEEYRDLMEYLSPRRCVVLSFRGRGESGTPESGYSLDDHVSDIETVVQSAELDRFHLYSYSRGVSYALRYLEKYPSRVVSLMVQDYPPCHKKMSNEWGEEYINNYLVPFSRQRNIRPEAVRGIQRDSEQIELRYQTDKKMLVLRGLLDGSLLDDGAVKEYQGMSSNVKVQNFERSGHDIRNTQKDSLYQTINQFMNSV